MTDTASTSADRLRLLQDLHEQGLSDTLLAEALSGPERLRAVTTAALTRAAMDILDALPPASRLRFLAFIQLFERPEAVRVELASGAKGGLRLTLLQPPQA
ncbi:MAG: hypothetical protein ABWY78_08830 [Microvirga sp.]